MKDIDPTKYNVEERKRLRHAGSRVVRIEVRVDEPDLSTAVRREIALRAAEGMVDPNDDKGKMVAQDAYYVGFSTWDVVLWEERG